jgi:hypothetical protein
VLDIVKFIGLPGSVPFVVVAALIGAALVRFSRRFRRVGIVWLVVTALTYIVLALPVVANEIAAALPGWNNQGTGIKQSHPQDGVEILIILDGDNRRGRVREAQRVMHLKRPTAVWVLGGRWILEALEEAGVSGSMFRYDATAETTREQLEQVTNISRTAPKAATAVIASRLQAPRVAALVRARGLMVRVLPSEIDDEPPISGTVCYVPSYVALRVSRDGIYEHAALAYYRWRGWIR